MKKKEIYKKIQENAYMDEIEATFGKNYTNCTNDELEMFLQNHPTTEDMIHDTAIETVEEKMEAIKEAKEYYRDLFEKCNKSLAFASLAIKEAHDILERLTVMCINPEAVS